MMMHTTRYLLVALGVLMLAGSAQADLVAGWDFSQYDGDGSLNTELGDFTGEGTLSANWSTVSALPDGGGPEANPFGTMYIDGTNGSTLTDFEFGFPAEFATSAGSLTTNVARPQLEGATAQFGSCTAVQPQDYCLANKMKAIASVDVVFEATLAPLGGGLVGEDWLLTFAANTDAGQDDLTIETSLDGIDYVGLTPELLTTTDTEYVVDLGDALDGAATIFVRLGFTGELIDGSNLDNLGISANVVPEPGTAALLLAGLLGLASVRRPRA